MTRGEVSGSSSEEDDDDASSSSTDGCFRFRFEMSGILEGRALCAQGVGSFRGAEGLDFVW
jgi:hypothetical protein